MAGLLDTIFKATYYAKLGRIRWRANMWAIVGSQWDRRRIANANLIGHRSVNEKGEMVRDDHVLVKRACMALCPCPPGADFYFDGKRHWVPATECRKCPYHRPSGRYRFPRCVYSKSEDATVAAQETVKDVGDVMQQAVQHATRIIAGND